MERRMWSRRMRGVGAVCALALILAACGDDSDDSGQTTPPPTGSNPPPQGQTSPPSITGTAPSHAMVGHSYTFQPNVHSSQGSGTVWFSGTSIPGWASLDSNTGQLSGTPGQADIGLYQGITISATNDAGSNTLGPFSINVVDTASGSVTLSWEPPTEYEDGAPLSDLGGYRIYYGKSSRKYEHTVNVGAGLSTYVVDNLLPGTYYFAITAYNSVSLESRHSNEAVATVEGT